MDWILEVELWIAVILLFITVILAFRLPKMKSRKIWHPRGKRILITGASAGIGKEMALQLAAEGARLALLARREDILCEVADKCRKAGALCAVAIRGDVTDRETLSKAVQKALAAVGGGFDVVVLNAGMSQGCYFEDIKDLADADHLMNLNVMGVVNTLHFCMPTLPKLSTTRIVIISSIAGVMGAPFRTLYCASKWALHGFAASLRNELQDAYGADAPKVVLTCPPETKSDLNTNRLEFGAGKPAESIPQVQMKTAELVEQLIWDGIVPGVRTQQFSSKASIIAALYSIIPGYVDRKVMKHIKRTTKMNGQGRGM